MHLNYFDMVHAEFEIDFLCDVVHESRRDVEVCGQHAMGNALHRIVFMFESARNCRISPHPMLDS